MQRNFDGVVIRAASSPAITWFRYITRYWHRRQSFLTQIYIVCFVCFTTDEFTLFWGWSRRLKSRLVVICACKNFFSNFECFREIFRGKFQLDLFYVFCFRVVAIFFFFKAEHATFSFFVHVTEEFQLDHRLYFKIVAIFWTRNGKMKFLLLSSFLQRTTFGISYICHDSITVYFALF